MKNSRATKIRRKTIRNSPHNNVTNSVHCQSSTYVCHLLYNSHTSTHLNMKKSYTNYKQRPIKLDDQEMPSPLQPGPVLQEQDLCLPGSQPLVYTLMFWKFLSTSWFTDQTLKKRRYPKTNKLEIAGKLTETKHKLTGAPVSLSNDLKIDVGTKLQSIENQCHLPIPCCCPVLLSLIKATSKTLPCSSNKGRIWHHANSSFRTTTITSGLS